jgi:threonine dehydrogenase-like Zn-dependent dehydrogenase
MKATVFEGKNRIALKSKPVPKPGYNEALVRIALTTICGTDLHIVRGEYPVQLGLTIGHEPVGVIEELGPGITGYNRGTRVLIGAITPCGQCEFCLSGRWAQCGGRLGGWKFGNTIDGCQAEYVLLPNAQANLAPIPDTLSNEDVVLLADIASTGLSASETANVQLGDTVAVFAQGPIGLCATAGARLKGASTVIGIDSDRTRLRVAKEMGADEVVDYSSKDPVWTWRRCRDRSVRFTADI